MNIANRVPIDQTARIVTSKGVRYESSKKICTQDSESRLPTKPFGGRAENLKGRKQGKLTVIGQSRDFRGRWVVLCACGIYTIRKSKSIKNKNNSWDCCETCRELIYLKRSEEFRRTGTNSDESPRKEK